MLVIADDLSGAADCGVACVREGLRSQVVFGTIEGQIDSDVLAVDVDSRHLDPRTAAIETARIIRWYSREQSPLVFKKVDSTLRGNFASELAAAVEVHRDSARPAQQKSVTIFAPAFPAQGRTTRDGIQLLNGRRLEQSDMAESSVTPRQNILEAFQLAGLRSALVKLELVRSGVDVLRDAMSSMTAETDLLVCDAETDIDLRSVAIAASALGPEVLWAGSAGLAYHVPSAAGLKPASYSQVDVPLAQGPTLFVIGSLSSVSRAQARMVRSMPEVITVEFAPEVLLAGPLSARWRQQAYKLEQSLSTGRDVIVLTGNESSTGGPEAWQIKSSLAQLIAPCAEIVGALVATGGETARAVLQAWGVGRLDLVGELEAGLPLLVTAEWHRNLLVCTKAGGFGKPETLQRCRQFLRNIDRSSSARLYPWKG